jgi:hypothetical protein
MTRRTVQVFRVKTLTHTLKKRTSYLYGEERLVCVGRILLKEAREKLEVGTRRIEPVEFACSFRMGSLV